MTSNAVDNTQIAERPRWLKWLLRSIFVVLAGAVLSAPWWGPPSLSKLDYFRIRKVEFAGVRYAKTSELIARLALDSTSSIWHDLDAYAARIAKHPMVQSVDITRTMPSTIVVTVVERIPVALVPGRGALGPVDATGHELPIDPTAHTIDAPIVATADTTILRFLDGLRAESPQMYARVVEIRRVAKGELWMQLKGVVVRTRDDVTVERLDDILRVEQSLAQQNQHAVELDLRFQDQVIARLP